MRGLIVNGQHRRVDAPDGMPLLWVLRDLLKLRGTKFGCGIGQCGACTVHLDGQPARSCSIAIEAVADAKVTTIEGLSADGTHPLQRAWIEHQIPQCGYCQTGQIMAAAALLGSTPAPTDQDIDATMTNICRCGTYPRIKKAIRSVAPVAAEAQ